MPASSPAEENHLRERLRTFHLTGRGLEDMKPKTALRPAILDEPAQIPDLKSGYPICVASGQPSKPLAEILGNSPDAGTIVAAFRIAMGDRPVVALADMRDAALKIASAEGCSEDAGKRIPAKGWLAGFSAEALPWLYAAALASEREKSRAAFSRQLNNCIAGVEGLLAVDDAQASGPTFAEQLSASLGMEAQTFFKPSALADSFNRPGQATHRMDPQRRARCASTLAMLSAALREYNKQPLFWLFHSDPAISGVTAFGGRCCRSTDGFTDALELCNRQLEWLVPVLRAMRVSRLEVESAFDADVHSQLLERFEWQTADPEELAALPAVVVMEPVVRLAETSLTSFSRVLRSGRPIQVVALSPGLCDEDLSGGMSPDLGYLAMAHREAFVVQTSMVQVNHLLQGLQEASRTLRPAVTVVSVPDPSESDATAWLEGSVAVFSRTAPIYRYDPDRALRQERFQLFNPAAEFASLTAAHAAALSKPLRHHFRIIPGSAWDNEQVEVHEYLAKYEVAPPLAIPYLWITDGEGQRQRAVFTRELVNLCRDRSRAWETFAELTDAQLGSVQETSQTQEQAQRLGFEQAIQSVLAMLADPLNLHT